MIHRCTLTCQRGQCQQFGQERGRRDEQQRRKKELTDQQTAKTPVFPQRGPEPLQTLAQGGGHEDILPSNSNNRMGAMGVEHVSMEEKREGGVAVCRDKYGGMWL